MPPRLPNEFPIVPTRAAALLAIALTLSACATRQTAPVEDRVVARPPPPIAAPAPMPPPPPPAAAESDWRPQSYTVKRGDTLQQIALDHGLDYRELAAWNSLDNPNVIRVGQVLRLAAPGATAPSAAAAAATTTPLRAPPAAVEARPLPTAPIARGDNVKSSPKAIREPYSEHAVREVTLASNAPVPAAAPITASTPAPQSAHAPETVAIAPPSPLRTEPKAETPRTPPPDTGEEDRLDWAWPVKGKIIGGFSEASNLKGIDIAGNAGAPVLASAPGKVVYAGSGLRGYGKLIIIKHNKTYLSAYAHNRNLLVKEGDQVGKGQKIAEMGNTDAGEVKLHFEIRRLGRPMDPARFLPPA